MLIGRDAECAVLTGLLDRARGGASGALVVHGEAGIGKSALLEQAAAAATGFAVHRVAGVEAEADFAHAGLHQLCAPLREHLGAHLDALPVPQQHALGVALGLRSGPAPDRFLTGLATLGLLAEAAATRPLLCLLDDAQWLDPASGHALAFAARRLDAEQVVLVFAVRDLDRAPELAGLAELAVTGLSTGDARAVLTARLRAPLDDAVRDRIVAEARGNPLALVELPRGPADLAGGFALPDATPVPRRIEDALLRRSAELPGPTRLMLLAAAAEPLGDVALLRRAGRHLGADLDALAPAEAADLLEVGDRVRFRHPLARSAVYHSATPPQRRRVHAALATATDPATDPDRRAWHRARAVLGPDDEVAAELERSADRATARGGLAAAAAFLARAAALTEHPTDRARRTLAAATAADAAGAPEEALRLLAPVGDASAGPAHDARVRLLRAQVAFHRRRGNDAPALLLDAAAALAPLDPSAAREAYLQAVEASLIAGPLARDAPRLHAALLGAPPSPAPPRPTDLLLDALTTHATRGYPASVPGLRRVVTTFLEMTPSADPADLRRLWLGGHAAIALWDDGAAHTLAWRHLRLTREAGALSALPFALTFLATVLVHTGELGQVAALVAETGTVTDATGAAPLPHAGLLLAAWRGRREETVARHTAAVRDATARGEGTVITIAEHGLAVLYNGLGRYDDALAAARRVHAAGELVHTGTVLPELVEAAVRGGDPDRARAASDQLGDWARAADTPWAHGLAARARALTGHGAAAEEAHRDSLTHLGRSRAVTDRARSRLLYGEWLRREGRRTDAREQLRTAHDLLAGMGADAFAARAARELAATGEHVRARTDTPAGTTEPLTEREGHIARLVATGATSREVGEQLFLSPRTVDAHLRNIFRKLDLTSRRQLRDAPLS